MGVSDLGRYYEILGLVRGASTRSSQRSRGGRAAQWAKAISAGSARLEPRAALVETNLAAANLTEVDLSSADLTGSRFDKANLSHANMVGAILYRADLARATGYIRPGQRHVEGLPN